MRRYREPASNPSNCAYCNELATTIDHYERPLSWAGIKRKTSLAQRNRVSRKLGQLEPGTVFSCNSCNAILADCAWRTIPERASYILNRIQHKPKIAPSRIAYLRKVALSGA